MRLVTKVMAGLVLATALLLASGDSGLASIQLRLPHH